jgi:hypothetical protein
MPYVDRKKLKNSIALCVGASIYWFVIMSRLLYYFLKGS